MNDFRSIETIEFSIFRYDHESRIYPDWMIRYFEDLTYDEQWRYFLTYRKVANQLVTDDFLIEQLKWILKRPSFELEYDLYIQFMFHSDYACDDVFKCGTFERWVDKYNQRFEEEFNETLETPTTWAKSLDDRMDELPF